MKWIKAHYSFLFIYIATLLFLVSQIVFTLDAPIISDAYQEYKLYAYTVENGGWHRVGSSLVNSSVFVTFIPAWIHRLTHLDPILVFRLFPQFFYALLPAFSYYLAKLYTQRKYALFASAFVFTNFYFIYFSEIGRVGVGFGLMAGLIYFLITGKRKLAVIFAVLLPFAHYGTYFLTAGLLVGAVVLLVVRKRWNTVRLVAIPLAVLIIVGAIWHFGIVQSSGKYSVIATKKAIASVTEEITVDKSSNANEVEIPVDNSVAEEKDKRQLSLFTLESRGKVVQVAFGKTFPYINLPQRIEFVVSWLMCLTLASSVFYTWKRKKLQPCHLELSIGAVLMFLVGLVFPRASVAYGIARFYFTAVIILAPCFALLAERIKYYYPLLLLVTYSTLLSGVLYTWLGYVKG